MFKKELIEAMSKELVNDEYNEIEQKHSRGMDDFLNMTEEFVKRNMQTGNFLEIGCGGGLSFSHFPITHAIEPCDMRRNTASGKTNIKIITGYSENIPYLDGYFNTVLMLDIFDQVRSILESVTEVNRVLTKGGLFIFDCQVDDSVDINYGIVFGFNNLRRYLEDFGFQAREVRRIKRRGLYAMEKVYNWTPKMIRKLQIVPVGNTWVAKNFHPEEEFHKKYL